MYAIYQHLQDDFDCYFSQTYGDTLDVKAYRGLGFGENTILGGHFMATASEFLKDHGLKNDYACKSYDNDYDLLVHCTDMIMPKRSKRIKSIWVQEGMTDPITPWARFTQKLGLPGYYAMNTSLNGTSNRLDIYCCASEGYKDHFVHYGGQRDRFIVTGIPNYDNAEAYKENDFPHRDFVLVVTSDNREVLNEDDREEFIEHAVKIANGRPMIFKLHPNEDFDRAVPEIKEQTPEGTLVFTDGNAHEMIANCEEFVAQYSTLAYTALALNKPVSSYFDVEELKAKTPIQNGGDSGRRIAEVCRGFIEYPKKDGPAFLKQFKPDWE